jgi:hypothetical protein
MSLATAERGRWTTVAALVAAAATVTGAAWLALQAGPSSATAADHLDAPSLQPPPGGDGTGTDITDVYAFRSPSDASKTVLIMNVNGLTTADLGNAPGPDRAFSSALPKVHTTLPVLYTFRVDSDGDAGEDVGVEIAFGRPDAGGAQDMRVKIRGAGPEIELEGRSTGFGRPAVVNRGPRGIKAFAGRRDDPFFFDLVGFLQILDLGGRSLVGCGGPSSHPERDTFAGQNVSSIAVELPSTLLTGGGDASIGVWATTTAGDDQIDRMGRPAVNTVFIPNNPLPPDRAVDGKASAKTSFNHGDPSTDVAQWTAEVVDTLQFAFSLNDPGTGLGGTDDPSDDAAAIAGLAGVLLPDILTVDVSSGAGFLNGRRLADDVIDAELGLVTEGFVTTDCVSANDVAFSSSFPYLAAPHS